MSNLQSGCINFGVGCKCGILVLGGLSATSLGAENNHGGIMKAFNILFMVIALIASACDSTSDNQYSVEPFIDSSIDKVDLLIIGNVSKFTLEGVDMS